MRPRLLPACLLFVLTCGPVRRAVAQAAAPLPPRDTAYAVHNLFRERRFKGMREAGYGMAGLTGTGFELAHGQTGAWVLLGLIGAVPTALGTRQYFRYSPEREGGMVRQYEQGWPLPPGIRRRLRARHFKALAVPQ
ncbi:MAG: hypothetical protein JWP58_2324 [Hymenobacter sp.]|nr:hypothetical protein [Hymenobacter sp.]